MRLILPTFNGYPWGRLWFNRWTVGVWKPWARIGRVGLLDYRKTIHSGLFAELRAICRPAAEIEWEADEFLDYTYTKIDWPDTIE